jgi:uncharacterized protein
MATTYSTPGVYIQEIATLPASVAQVDTAIPAFIGLTKNTVVGPRRISSMAEYIEIFGGATEAIMTITCTPATSNYTLSAPVYTAANKKKNLYYHMQMYFSNGGGPCYVISASSTGAITKLKCEDALALLKLEDEPTLILIPEAIHLAGDYSAIMKAALTQCNSLQDRFTIMDLKDNSGVFATDLTNFRTDVGTQYLKYGAAYYPYLSTSLTYSDESIALSFVAGVPLTPATLVIPVVIKSLAEVIQIANDPLHVDTVKYANFLNLSLGSIRDTISQQLIELGPSSSIAGVYASVDRDRGVWKAPANVSLNSVIEPSFKLNNADQEAFNVTSSGKSVNVIRLFNGKGNIVWGARTLAGNDNEWRYISVRRLFITAEESIKKATEFVVFEPNDKNTWERVRAMIQNYLTNLWRQGALAGSKPEDAFFVNVGLGETMSPQDILDGKLIVEIGMAAVRPAEFIILNFSHKLQES